MQFGSPVKPVTVKLAGDPGEAGAEDGLGVPVAHERLIVTAVVGPAGLYALLTLKLALLSVLVIVHAPLLTSADVHVPAGVPLPV